MFERYRLTKCVDRMRDNVIMITCARRCARTTTQRHNDNANMKTQKTKTNAPTTDTNTDDAKRADEIAALLAELRATDKSQRATKKSIRRKLRARNYYISRQPSNVTAPTQS